MLFVSFLIDFTFSFPPLRATILQWFGLAGQFADSRARNVHTQGYSGKFPLTLIKENTMTESVYKIIEMVGSSPVSWEEATKNAVKTAGLTLRDLRIAEVVTLDMKIDEKSGESTFRARVKLSFKIVSD
jgi:hypothetical protein